MRYRVEVKNGRRIQERFESNDYEEAMDKLDELETQYADSYTVEFTDMLLYKGKK